MNIGDLLDMVVQAGEVAGALAALAALLVAVVRFAILRPLTATIDERIGAVHAQIDARLDRVEYELNPNGGGSMRDAVRRIETKVDTANAALTAHATYIRAQATATAAGAPSPRPSDFGI